MIRGYDFSTNEVFCEKVSELTESSRLAIICDANDISSLMDVFKWDRDTIEECTNIDETVRYTSYEGYDFISLIYAEADKKKLSQQEINIFIAQRYFVLVLPEKLDIRLKKLIELYTKAMDLAINRNAPLIYLYYVLFDNFTTDYSNMLEELEDEIEDLSEAIENKPVKEHSVEIGRLRKTAYVYKKLLRALSYIGGQILMDENHLLNKKHTRFFHNIDTRFLKLYDFADNLYDLSNELLHTFDSKSSAQMNETINKLTVITLFFGPMTVIAGIYGMNFTNMPELDWKYGYPAALLMMAVISIFIYVILKKNKWL